MNELQKPSTDPHSVLLVHSEVLKAAQAEKEYPHLIKRYIIMHETEGFIAAVYAERFSKVGPGEANSFTGNRCGHFWIGSEIVGTVDNPRCSVGISGVMNDSRPKELRASCLTMDEIAAINQENREIQLM